MIKEAIVKIVDKQDLTYDEAYQVMSEIMSGETTQTQNAAFLAALSTKSTGSETIDEISGCAVAMREKATRVEHPGMEVLEIVGTGGGQCEELQHLHDFCLYSRGGRREGGQAREPGGFLLERNG